MPSYTRPRFGAIALGLACGLGAAAILIEDVRHSHEFSVDHLLSLLVLAATIGAGHIGMAELRSARILRALSLAVLFVLGTAWCVKSTASRIAEVKSHKVSAAQSHAVPRRETERELATARLAVQDAKARADKACKSDANGEQCRIWTRREKAYQSQVNEIIRDMGTLPPDKTGRDGTRYAAELASLVYGVTAGRAETVLGLLDPLIGAVLLEFGTIAFLGIGLTHRRSLPVLPGPTPSRVVPVQSRPVPAYPVASRPPLAALPKRSDPDAEAAWVRDFAGSHGRKPTIAEVQAAFPHLARSTAHRRIQAA
jgi:hypothetical protein